MYLAFILLYLVSGFSVDGENPEMLRVHDFHTSLAEVEYNTSSKAFEVSLRIFTDDLETALSQRSGLKNLSLDKTKKHDVLIEAYIQDNFYLLNPKNQKVTISFYGKELETDITWVFFEIPLKKYKPGYKLRNSILIEQFNDQVNFVNLKYKGKKKSYLLKRDKISAELILE